MKRFQRPRVQTLEFRLSLESSLRNRKESFTALGDAMYSRVSHTPTAVPAPRMYSLTFSSVIFNVYNVPLSLLK